MNGQPEMVFRQDPVFCFSLILNPRELIFICIFPALMVVLLGPAALRIQEALL